IAGVATVREPDGLALSSRNQNLTPDQRAIAPLLYRQLHETAARLAAGRAAAPELARACEALRAAGFSDVDYVELRDGETLAPLERARPPARLFAAASLGVTRLIDNVPVV
ncbi:MAG: pantoate--beta-alanine ligase, partial [Alphaproteobacteria bacterium]